MRKLLFITTELPSKLGGLRRLYYNILHFSRKFEVHLIRVKMKEDKYRNAQLNIPTWVKLKEIEAKKPIFDPSCILFPAYAAQIMRLQSTILDIQEYIDKNGIEVVITHTSTCTLAFRKLKAPIKIGEMLDSYVTYYKSKYIEKKSPKNLVLWIVLPFLYNIAEKLISSDYDLLVYVSKIDLSASKAKPERLLACGDTRNPPIKKQNLGNRRHDVVMLGQWMHPPNIDGLRRIQNELEKIKGNVTIIGPNLKPNTKFPPNVKAFGFVKDISMELSNFKICVVPVWYGAGLQNKVFDALRHGCIVVTTPFTKQQFEANGFVTECILSSDNIIEETNKALEIWSPLLAKKAYNAYERFWKISVKAEENYVARVLKLAQSKSNKSNYSH